MLSNVSTSRDVHLPTGAAAIALRKATSSEVQACLRLILGSASELASDSQVVDFLRFAMYRGIELTDMWLAERRGTIVWAILPVHSPGRTVVLFSPPHVAPTLQETVAPQLIATVLGESRARDVHLAQALIDPGDTSVIDLYQRSGFSRLAELVYLNRELRRAEAVDFPPALSLLRYSPQKHALFARAIAITYANSLDCPALNGRRDIEDVIAGHKSVGNFDPALWFVLLEHGEAIGVSLLNRSPHSDAIELVYLGLCPAARGRGIADLLMSHTLHAATASNARTLTLAVDSRNAPALKLYHRHGLKQVCSRIALLRDLRELATRTSSSPALL